MTKVESTRHVREWRPWALAVLAVVAVGLLAGWVLPRGPLTTTQAITAMAAALRPCLPR